MKLPPLSAAIKIKNSSLYNALIVTLSILPHFNDHPYYAYPVLRFSTSSVSSWQDSEEDYIENDYGIKILNNYKYFTIINFDQREFLDIRKKYIQPWIPPEDIFIQRFCSYQYSSNLQLYRRG